MVSNTQVDRITIMAPLNAAGASPQSVCRSLLYLPVERKVIKYRYMYIRSKVGSGRVAANLPVTLNALMESGTLNPVAKTMTSTSYSSPLKVLRPPDVRRSSRSVTRWTFSLLKVFKSGSVQN